MQCKICNEDFPELKKLHFHIARKHKMKIENYYPQYYPRRDVLTGDLIAFKNYEFYMSSLFNNRPNMVKYLKNANETERIDVIGKLIALRKEFKGLRYAPSTVEARTGTALPSPLYVKVLGLDYNALCQKQGLAPRYKYDETIRIGNDSNFDILVDTREQKPLKFIDKTVSCKLDFGDYTTRSHYKGVFIERKSLADLCGTLSKGYERFQRELDRAVELGSYIVVMVEEDINSLMSLKYLPHTKFVGASSEFIAHRIRELCQKYDCVQFLFLKGRSEMADIVKKILLMENKISEVDCQYCYDSEQFSS